MKKEQNYYEKLQSKPARVRQEHSMKEAHEEGFSMDTRDMERLYDAIFSTEEVTLSPSSAIMMQATRKEDLMMTISINPDLFRVYSTHATVLLCQEAIKRGLPNEQVNDICRETFLQLAEAKTHDDLIEVNLSAAGEMNRRYRLFSQEHFSYQVRSATEYIHRKRYQNIAASDVAAAVRSDRTYLAKIFKHETGMTITDYITKVKMETASDVIYTHTYTLAEIAELLGYSSYAVFCRKFERYFGFSPKKYESTKVQQKP